MSASAEAFLDQLVTWRELGYHAAARRPDDYDRYEALPAWARATLEKHAGDARPAHYAHDRLEQGDTGDDLWNAAQRQLRGEGRIHNYLRMLWASACSSGPDAARALAALFALNDRWLSTGATRTPRAASAGASAGTTGPGRRSARSTAWCATCRAQHAAQAAPDRLPAPLVGPARADLAPAG